MAMLLAGACNAQGAGLGTLSVYSGIGQQLNAEVALNATPAELGSMSARLASPEAFKEAGIEYMPVLSDLHIQIEKSASGQPVLKLTTTRPVTEPFLHFLVELSWGSGRMIREYTFLLDPPEMLQVAKPASVVSPAAPAMTSLLAPTGATQTASASKAAKPAPSSGGEYQVKPGDTLSKIARETRPESVTLDQMLVALFDHNPEAFQGGNMNRLRAGKILRIPAAEEAAKIDPATARKLVINQTSEFAAYRRRLAVMVAAAPAEAAAPRQQVAGTIKPQVEDKTPPPEAKDKLEVSRTEPAKSKPATGGSSLEEDLIARDKALREASERIALLEKNIENLKKLVEIKSQTGTALQQQSEAAAPAAAPAKPVEPAKSEAPLPKVEEAKPTAPAAPAAVKPAEPAPPTASESAQPAKSVTPPPAPKKPAPSPAPPAAEPSFVEENPEIVYGGAGLIALLLGYLGYAAWRRKKAAEKPAGSAAAAAATAAAIEKSPAPSEPAASFESGEVSIQGEFSQGGLLTSEEIVDPVAEAEVLMAYGRDRQAEEVLQSGLAKEPSRTAIHMKLLELYAKQENIARFEAVATKLHELDKGQGTDWDKVVAMAHSLGLFGGIFAAGAATAEALQPAKAADNVATPSTAETTIQSKAIMERAAAEQAPVPQETAAAMEEAPSLEFDLDLGSPAAEGQTATPVIQTQAIGAPAEEAGIALDFDFDLGSPEAEQAVAAVVEKAEATVAENPPVLDFELDLGSPVVEAEQTALEKPLDIDFDFDLNPATDTESGTAAVTAAAETAVAVPPVEAPAEAASLPGSGDLKLDFDLELEEASTDKLPVPPVPEPQGENAGESVAAAAAAAPAAIDNAEAATKLELAQAYEEMGDLEGARELLNEVLNEGSPSQQAQAKAKLEQLGAS